LLVHINPSKSTFRLAVLLFCSAVLINSCGKNKENASPAVDRTNIESDYVGKIAALLRSDILSSADSLKLIQYAYQAASLDARLYELNIALIKSYFAACHEKCEKRKCSTGDIVAMAVACALESNLDSARIIAGLADKELIGESAVADELVHSIKLIGERVSIDEMMNLFKSGKVKTPAALEFLAIMAIDMGASPEQWYGLLNKELEKSDSPSLKYAAAYAKYKLGDINEAWQSLPDYLPLAKIYPSPSFSEKVVIDDSTYTQKIYLPVDLYVIKHIRQAFLKNALEKYPDQNSVNLKALKILAKIKNLDQFKKISFPEVNPNFEPENPAGQLLEAIRMSQSSDLNPSADLSRLSDAVSRAAYLQAVAFIENKNIKFKELLLAEIDSSRAKRNWESKVLLSMALRQTLPASETFSRLNNLGVSDLSVRNNSPEWLAIYATTGLEESSQMALVSQIGFNLTQYYPYAVGIYELMQNLNHICKYY